MTTRPRRRSPSDDRGAMVVEFVIVIPILFMILALMYAFGEKVQTDGLLDAGTRDAARAATQARTYSDAVAAANSAIDSSVGIGPGGCLSGTLQVSVEPDAADFAPGAVVTVRATCEHDVDLLGATLRLHPSSTFSSALDPNRGIN